jgi:hypothetical protein
MGLASTSPGLRGKRLEPRKAVAPGRFRVAGCWNLTNPRHGLALNRVHGSGPEVLGVTLQPHFFTVNLASGIVRDPNRWQS